MFDADTVALMASAPGLEGLDLANLPKELTTAYAAIVAARIRLRSARPTEVESVLPEDATALITRMRRLSFTHEALVSVSPSREDRAAAAFVAGAAHHVVLQAARLAAPEPAASRLALDGISPEVSATLLFLIAEACADASEMAKAIRIDESQNPVERALLAAIRDLANGALEAILDSTLPSGDSILTGSATNQAVHALHFMLLRGLRALAAHLLGEAAVIARGLQDLDPKAVFDEAAALCSEPLPGVDVGEGGLAYSLYPGPRHLAVLLGAVARDFPEAGLAAQPAPNGVDGGRWANLLMEIAVQRPYLWRNHRKAIEAGYLESGVSAAVSFPTGAGKSTLSELKIASALLRGAKVIVLAPTLALVDQTARALAKIFVSAEVQRERAEATLFDFDDEALPTISVMTPERCLALMSFDRDAFAEVGLLVFDECHLLHPRQLDRSRRAIDAMLCVLNFTGLAPDADLLLVSAMMGNSGDIAEWVSDLTGRVCLALDLTWKPTRQVRGCVVYGAAEINALNQRLTEVRREVSNKHAPAQLKRELKVKPFGFFCLHQTWRSEQRGDYALLPLLDQPVLLTTGTAKGGYWYLTPNGNQVASALAVGAAASSAAMQGLKTLVFTQTIPLAQSAAATVSTMLGPRNCVLTKEEQRLLEIAIDELGGEDHLYIEFAEDRRLLSSSAPHHGLLLPAERHLHESLFKRPEGVNVLVATSTLAQGINLPSQVVIIGGDSRFDPSADRMEKLEAHEVLNAAGRAGRAGESAYGFVLVVPSKVVHFDDATSQIHTHWAHLRAIFAQSDQCLEIEDPIEPLLDQIHLLGTQAGESAHYLLRRLPVGDAGEPDPDAQARRLLLRSMAAFHARKSGDQAWIDSRIGAAMAARRADPMAAPALDWADHLAAAAGIDVVVVRDLEARLESSPPTSEAEVPAWRDWVLDWLSTRPQLVPQLFRRESLEGLLGKTYKNLGDDNVRGGHALPVLRNLLGRWMSGETLVDLERGFGTAEHRLGRCEAAREFVLRLTPELAYLCGLTAQVVQAMEAIKEEPGELPAALLALGACVREGFDAVEKLALHQVRRRRLSRVAVHRQWPNVAFFGVSATPDESFASVLERVKLAAQRYDATL